MNMINKLVSVGAIFAFVAVFSPAIVQSEEVPVRGPAPFSAYDEDGSGSISEDEFNAMHKKRMAARAAEGRPMRGAANPPSFSDFDTNDDGELNQDELTAGQQARRAERPGAAKVASQSGAGTGNSMMQGCMGKGMKGMKGMNQGCCKGGMGKNMKGMKGMNQGCCGGSTGNGMMQGCMGKGMKGMKGMNQGGGMGNGMMKGCTMNMSKTRHHYVMRNGVDKKYVDETNPLQSSAGTIKSGKGLYEKNCASCHGLTGQGDGEAGKGLSPGPTDIAMFSKMPMASDGYLLWAVSEGGVPLKTAMPAFKNKLTADDIWKITIYLRQL